MEYKRKVLYLFLLFMLYKAIFAIFLFNRGFYDIFIPLLPFVTLLSGTATIIGFYLITGITSSVIHYDELFGNMLGYGISIILLISLSKRYFLLHIFNYLASIFVISLLNFTILLLAYLIKDEIVVFGEVYRYLFLNLFVGIFYYFSYRIMTFRVADYAKG